MASRSFSPRQFFDLDQDEPDTHFTEETPMWVYRIENGSFVVGYYSPDKEWHPDSVYREREEAAKRVAWLNGSGPLYARQERTK